MTIEISEAKIEEATACFLGKVEKLDAETLGYCDEEKFGWAYIFDFFVEAVAETLTVPADDIWVVLDYYAFYEEANEDIDREQAALDTYRTAMEKAATEYVSTRSL